MNTAVEPSALAEVDYDPFAQTALARVVAVTQPQREVWLADKLGSDGSLAYNESISVQLRGALNADALCAAVGELTQRHESLRATISPNGDELCIAQHLDLDAVRRDLSGLAPGARAGALADRLREVVRTPFDLERGPLIRAELLQLAPDEHVLVLTAHHIVCDGWSFGVLLRDLAAGYARRVGYPGADIGPAPSFADYAQLQAAWSRGAQCRADEQYWLSRFDGVAPTLDLPLDRPRPRQRTFVASREDVMLDAELVAALRKFGARRGASLFATLFTGFATLMRRLSGQADVVVGVAAAGQSVGGYDSLVGHCVNILPVRTDVAAGTGFGAALDATNATLLDAFEHQQYTFGTLLQKLAIPRDPSRLPLVSVLFNLDQPLDVSTVRFPGLALECSANARSFENFELFVNAVPVAAGLRLECQYNRDLFDAASVRRWMDALGALLRSAASDPDTACDRLEWLSSRQRLALVALQPQPTLHDTTRLVHHRFVEQAHAHPQHIAVAFGTSEVSYAQLDHRSNAIAHALRDRAIGRGALVGVCLDREPDLYATVLGILKTGAGFVPLDPAFPKDRLNYMVNDAAVAAVVSKAALLGTVDTPRAQVLSLDTDMDEAAWAHIDAIGEDAQSATPDSPAYVIHTSGSTGKPKGVVVPHRCLVNLLCSMQRTPGLVPADRLVAVTTLSFDISMLELFLPLIVGARVVLATSEVVRDAGALRGLLESSGATAMQATPSGWRVLLESGWDGGREFKALVGGEGLPVDLALALRGRCGELWNMYGPTETTIWSTCTLVRDPERGISIGVPIDNTSVWVLDDHGAPCPVGVPGELWIGGAGVTSGYLNRPVLTAERFVPDPRSDEPGARLYGTGDRGRWRNDGELEHLGRLDFQVKVRGYRIELGEIEANLANHPVVARCVVIAREDRPGDVRLVAYVVRHAAVAAAGQEPTGEESLHEHLRTTLPAYMIPQHFVMVAAIPLSPNGKLDRKALPAPNAGLQRAVERCAPRTEMEIAVAAVMEQVLALPDIDVDDDFFALGGHSLLAAQLTSRLNRQLGTTLSMRALFDAPTVARLAQLLSSQSTDAAPQPTPIVRRTEQHRAPLSLMQERLRLLDQFNPGQLSYNTPSAHRLTGPLDVVLLDRALRDLAHRQTVLRTTIAIEGDAPVQVIHDDVETGLLQVHDLRDVPAADRDAELARRLRALVEVPFLDLSRAPLFCARLFKLDSDVHVLFFMPHHIIWDGWSFDLLYAQLSEHYAALVENRAPVLAELPVTYGDYAAWHRHWVTGPEYARQLAFWRERIGGKQGETLQRLRVLPTDKPRRPGMSGNGGSQAFTIPRQLTIELRETGLRTDATLFVTLLTAYYALMSAVTGQRDLIVSTPVRGRNSAQVEDLMGYFTNLLPLRVQVDPTQSFARAVREVKAMVLDSFACPDIRLEDLARDLSLRSEGGGVLYQSLFSFQDIRQRIVQWGPLKHERVEVLQPGATEDLGIWFIQDNEGLSGGLVYNADIFHDETIVLLRERYLAVLRAIARDPELSIDALTRFDDGRPALIGAAASTSARHGLNASNPATRASDIGPSASATTALVSDDPRVRYLVELWTQILGTPAGPGDNFFDLGGNSMLGVQMAERVARDTGLRIKLVRLAAQDLAQIAADLPSTIGKDAAAGLRNRLLGNVKRLFGRTAVESER